MGMLRPGPSLNDALMQGIDGQPPVITTPGSTNTPDGIDPALYEQAFAPDNLGPRPDVKRSGLATFLLGLGDALNSSASILGRSDVRTHNLQSYMDYLEGQKQAASGYDRLKASQESESKRNKARFLIDQDQRKKMKAYEQAGREILQKAALADKEEARQQKLEEFNRTKDLQEAQFKATKDWEEKKLNLSNEKDLAVARIHASGSDGTNPQAKFDIKALPETMGQINELVDSVDVLLAGDPAKNIAPMPEKKIWDRVRRGIEASGLSPDGKKAAYAHAESELGQAIKDFNEAKAAQQQQGTTVEGPPGIMDKFGRVITGKANLYNPGP